MDPTQQHLLFICGRARMRSPTAERVFSRDPGYACRARGLGSTAERKFRSEDVEWADAVFVMEWGQAERLRGQHRSALGRTPLHVLEIPELYAFMDPELIALLELRVAAALAEDGD